MRVDALLRACELERQHPAQSLDVSLRLHDGRWLAGTVGGVRGSTVLSVGYSSLAGKHRLAAWVRHLAVVATLGDSSVRSVTVGRRRDGAHRSLLHGVDAATARRLLSELVALRDLGLREPLPMAVATSEAYAERRQRGDDHAEAVSAAAQKWQAGRFDNENNETEHVLVHGGVLTLAELMAAPDGSRPDEPTRFGALARRLWTPLLDAEIDVQP